MLTGAILLAGTWSWDGFAARSGDTETQPLAFLELLGRSAFQRTVQRLVWGGITECVVLASAEHASLVARQLAALGPQIKSAVAVHVAETPDVVCEQVRRAGASFAAKGVEAAFISSLVAYAELDLEDIIYFFQASGQDAVGVINAQGDLDIWFAKSGALAEGSIGLNQLRKQEFERSYLFCGYARRIATIQDLRRFVIEVFQGRAEARPDGIETRPGVWIGEGAQVHRRARIVAPAYVGRHAKVGSATLITRYSSVECNSHINDHTALEDSSVLEDTYVGAGLDVMHCVVSGKHLAHLRRNVALDIEDDTLIGTNQVSTLRRVLRRYRESKADELIQSYPARTAQDFERPTGKA